MSTPRTACSVWFSRRTGGLLLLLPLLLTAAPVAKALDILGTGTETPAKKGAGKKAQVNNAPTPTLGEREKVASGSYSLQPPVNWEVSEKKGETTVDTALVVKGPSGLNLQAREAKADGITVAQFLEASTTMMKKRFTQFKVLDQESLETTGGVTCQRLHFEVQVGAKDPVHRQLFYAFEIAKGHVGFVACAGPLAKDEMMHSIFDAVISSIQLEK